MYKIIEKIIFNFYRTAIEDILIGYHFRKIKNFEEHIPHIAAFWTARLFPDEKQEIARSYNFIKAHAPLGIKRGEIDRWLVLFAESLENEEIDQELKDRWINETHTFATILRNKLL